jgi:glycerophosphoryl diester phosphodiesterase
VRHEYGEAWDLLFKPAIAHRGLWSPGGAPENSLEAFQLACQTDYGIELDVQLSADGEAMVFHDLKLDRLTTHEGRMTDHHTADLQAMALCGTDETIPTLAEALAVIGHQALVLIELKTPYGDVGPLEKRVSEILIDHNGPTAVIGFNPYSHAWFAQHHPQILRGLDSYSYRDNETLAREQRMAYAALEHIGLAKPNFLALGLDIIAKPAALKAREGGLPVIGWTAKSQADWDNVRDHADNMIFEGFSPA